MKKIIALFLVLVMSLGVLTGCGVGKKADDGKVHITISAWPVKETNPQKYEMYQRYLEEYKKMYPNVEVTTDTWNFDLKNYLVKAASGELPTVFRLVPTELDTLVNSGYVRDITDISKKFGYVDNYNTKYQRLYERDGKCYAVVDPASVYEMGLVVNAEVFKEAGLVDAEGLPLYPQTWEEVAETAATIKEKTGKTGFVFPTTNRHGGWQFMNIAWSYGVDFVKQEGDKWVAAFDTPECVEALQFLKDLKWKYNVLQDNLLVDHEEIQRLIGTDNAAMGINASSSILSMPKKYGGDMAHAAMCRMPAGPEGRTALTSANIYLFAEDATDEEVEAVFNWFNLIGLGPEVNDEMVTAWEEDYKAKAEENNIVGIKPLFVWKEGERTEAQYNAMKKFANVDEKNFVDYTSADDINLDFDPAKCAQELYDILDAAIQNILMNKDSDIKAIVSKAAVDYQKNFLDKTVNVK